jgi:hypothetical protein
MKLLRCEGASKFWLIDGREEFACVEAKPGDGWGGPAVIGTFA